tara:strand:+ start:16815 stop:16985 length:171 start_codon:yes stop_codon:yes gene_type:complete
MYTHITPASKLANLYIVKPIIDASSGLTVNKFLFLRSLANLRQRQGFDFKNKRKLP